MRQTYLDLNQNVNKPVVYKNELLESPKNIMAEIELNASFSNKILDEQQNFISFKHGKEMINEELAEREVKFTNLDQYHLHKRFTVSKRHVGSKSYNNSRHKLKKTEIVK